MNEKYYYVLLDGGRATDMGELNLSDLLYGFKKARLPGHEHFGYERLDGDYIIHGSDLENYYLSNRSRCFYAIMQGKAPEHTKDEIFSLKIFDSIQPIALVEWVPKNKK
ncbi:hypothetical protein AUQ24_15820 [Escherichia coli]|uniref:hypothetical protein n=1 Tax=Enterobacteriaceae TaxID=543 RepID=UPI000774F7E2|nr:hypothetical protein [Escherichia coli]KXR34372.1 hypothetical protein AUQ24_15820 [Escherichia coli]HCF8619417.1 hypothetical protein [Klebsiella pneumoniae]